jgi:hypothetical protein
MASLKIREYPDCAYAVGSFPLQIAEENDYITDQTALTIGSEAKSAAFAATTKFILITADAIFSYKVGANPTATTNMVRFPADTVLFFGVKAGDKLSVIANT